MEDQGKPPLPLFLVLEETLEGFPHEDSSEFILHPLTMLRPDLPTFTLVRAFITEGC